MKSIAFNVIGGVLTIIVSWLFQKELKRWHRRHFKEIFGRSEEPISWFTQVSSSAVTSTHSCPAMLTKVRNPQ
jgi:hypothetical protein